MIEKIILIVIPMLVFSQVSLNPRNCQQNGTQKCLKCSQNYHLFQGECYKNLEGCLVYVDGANCKQCIPRFQLLEPQNICLRTSRQFFDSSIFLDSVETSDYYLDLTLLQNYVRRQRLGQQIKLRGFYVLKSPRNTHLYFKLIFGVKLGYLQYLFQKQQTIPITYSRVGLQTYRFAKNTTEITKIQVELFSQISQQIQKISPDLSSKPYTILSVLNQQINPNRQTEVYILYILDEYYGIIVMQIQLQKINKVKLLAINVQSTRKSKQLEIINIIQSNRSSQRIIYQLTLQDEDDENITQLYHAVLENSQFSILREQSNGTNNSELIEEIVQYLNNSKLFPTEFCKNRLPLFSFYETEINYEQFYLTQQLQTNQIFSNQTLRQILDLTSDCYPQKFRKQPQQLSIYENQTLSYISIRFVVFNQIPQFFFIGYYIVKQSDSIILDQSISISSQITKKLQTEDQNIMFSSQQLEQFDGNVIQICRQLQKLNPQIISGRLIQVQTFPWFKFHKQLIHYILRYQFPNTEPYKYIKYQIDLQQKTQKLTFLPTIKSKSQKFKQINNKQIQTGVPGQINQFLITQYFPSNIDTPVSQIQIYQFYLSLDLKNKYILAYLIGSNLTVYQFSLNTTTIKLLRKSPLQSFNGDDIKIREYIIDGKYQQQFELKQQQKQFRQKQLPQLLLKYNNVFMSNNNNNQYINNNNINNNNIKQLQIQQIQITNINNQKQIKLTDINNSRQYKYDSQGRQLEIKTLYTNISRQNNNSINNLNDIVILQIRKLFRRFKLPEIANIQIQLHQQKYNNNNNGNNNEMMRMERLTLKIITVSSNTNKQQQQFRVIIQKVGNDIILQQLQNINVYNSNSNNDSKAYLYRQATLKQQQYRNIINIIGKQPKILSIFYGINIKQQYSSSSSNNNNNNNNNNNRQIKLIISDNKLGILQFKISINTTTNTTIQQQYKIILIQNIANGYIDIGYSIQQLQSLNKQQQQQNITTIASLQLQQIMRQQSMKYFQTFDIRNIVNIRSNQLIFWKLRILTTDLQTTTTVYQLQAYYRLQTTTTIIDNNSNSDRIIQINGIINNKNNKQQQQYNFILTSLKILTTKQLQLLQQQTIKQSNKQTNTIINYDQPFKLTLNNLYSKYSYYLPNYKILKATVQKKANIIYYIAIMATDINTMQAILSYSIQLTKQKLEQQQQLRQVTRILSFTPIVTYTSSIAQLTNINNIITNDNNEYKCDLMRILKQPIQYCYQNTIITTFNNSDRIQYQQCLAYMGVICLY